jgi:hypothetical protein
VITVFYSCHKSNDDAAAGNFVWTYNGVTNSTNTDTAFVSVFSLAYPPYTIVAGFPRSSSSSTIQKRVEFNLTSFATGTYTITSGAGAVNKMSYIDDVGNNLNGISGTITISTNAGNKISGNFSGVLVDGAAVNSQLSGSFTNMVVKP